MEKDKVPGKTGKRWGQSRRTQAGIRVLFGSATALGPSKVNLLDAILGTGSISTAALTMKHMKEAGRGWQ